MTISGSSAVEGYVHSDGGLTVKGRAALTSGAEYASTISIAGAATVEPPAVRTDLPDTPPVQIDAEAWRPGGIIQASSEFTYEAVSDDECVDGSYKPRKATDLTADVVYVPCAVEIAGSNWGHTSSTIVAEGSVAITARGARFTPAADLPAVISLAEDAEAVYIGASSTTFGGAVAAIGGVLAEGSRHVFECGIYADTVAVSGRGTFRACLTAS